MTTNPDISVITPLEERAVRRFEFDHVFHQRCRSYARSLKEKRPLDDLRKRLQDAMCELRTEDEAIHDDAAIVRRAFYLGNNVMGTPYALASVPEEESLKAAVRCILAAMDGQP